MKEASGSEYLQSCVVGVSQEWRIWRALGYEGYGVVASNAHLEVYPQEDNGMKLEMLLLVSRLDFLSCVLTICSTVLVGRRRWEGWVLAAANSLIICVIGLKTAQLAFIPANLFCIVLYAGNLRTWRKVMVS